MTLMERVYPSKQAIFLLGTLANGTTFIFSGNERELSNLNLSRVALPTLEASDLVDTDLRNAPAGVRNGQTLTLVSGGALGENFEAAGGTLNIEGGIVGDFAGASLATINI